jgi:hypothetical protein
MATRKSASLGAGDNPLEIIQDSRVLATGAGVLVAHISRNAIVQGARDTFGWASKDVGGGGGIKYYGSKTDAKGNKVVDTTKEIVSAYWARVLLGIGQVVAGTLLIGSQASAEPDANGNKGDPNFEYFGLGFAASGAANVFTAIAQLDT